MQTEVPAELVIPFELSIYHFHYVKPISDFSLFKSRLKSIFSFYHFMRILYI
jgi:hypothetical protein